MFRLTGTAIAEHALGHEQASRRALDELAAQHAAAAAYQVAETYAWRGEKDQAFEWLRRAYTQHDSGLSALKIDPLLTSLRGDPRYKALLRMTNLPE